MPIYEYQGQEYDIATTDHAEAKRKILAYLQRATAEDRASQVPSLANIQPQIQPSRNPSLIERIVGGFETGATVATSALSMPAAAVGGFVEGMRTSAPKIGTPEHNRMVEERARQIQQGMTYQPKTETGKEYLQTLGKAMQESKIPPYVPMPGFQPNLVKPAIQEAGQIARSTAGVPVDVAKGALGRATGYIAKPGEQPIGYQTASSRIPLGETYVEPKEWQRFQQGQLPYGEFPQERPISQLPRNRVEQAALAMSGGQMPYPGQAARSFGERIGETYQNPIQAAVDIGSLFTTGIPIMTAGRTALATGQGIADYLLSKRGFDPNLPKTMAEYRSGARPMPGAPSQGAINQTIQDLAASKVTGPVIPENMVAAQGGRPEPRLNLPDQQPVQQPTVQPAVPAQPQPVQQAPVQQAPVQQAPVQQAPVQPVNPIEAIYTQATQAGLAKDDLRKTVVATRAQQIVKEQKDAGLVVDKKTSQNLAAREADAYLAQIEEQTRAARQVERERIEAEKRAAFEATPEGQQQLARTQEIDAALAADPGLKPFLDEYRHTGSGRDRAIASQDVWDDIKQRRQREIEQENRPKQSNPEIQAKIEALRNKPMFTEEETAARQAAVSKVETPVATEAKSTTTTTTELPSKREFRGGLKLTLNGTVSKRGKQIKVDQAGIDDYLRSQGLDPVSVNVNLINLSVADARREIFDAVYSAVKNKLPKEKRATRAEIAARGAESMPPTMGEVRKDLYGTRKTGETNEQFEARVKTEFDRRYAPYAAKLEKIEQRDEKLMRVMGKTTGGSLFEAGKTSEQPKTTGMSPALQERLKQMQARGNYKPPKGLMEMSTGMRDRAQAAQDLFGDFLSGKQAKPTDFETTYTIPQGIVEEIKRPGYHNITITHSDGTKTIMKKHTIGDHTEYNVSKTDKFGMPRSQGTTKTKPDGWSSIEDEFTKGK